jgi:hypothetical protein
MHKAVALLYQHDPGIPACWVNLPRCSLVCARLHRMGQAMAAAKLRKLRAEAHVVVSQVQQ